MEFAFNKKDFDHYRSVKPSKIQRVIDFFFPLMHVRKWKFYQTFGCVDIDLGEKPIYIASLCLAGIAGEDIGDGDVVCVKEDGKLYKAI